MIDFFYYLCTDILYPKHSLRSRSSREIVTAFFLSKCGKKRAFLHDFKITKTLKILIFKSLRCGKKKNKNEKEKKKNKKNLIGSEILEKRLCL